MLLTVEQLKQLFPQNMNLQPLCDALNLLLPKYGIDTKAEICAYLTECGIESRGFTALVENLNYSAERLVEVFPKYFASVESAGQYAHNQQKIANYVYASRMGNGNTASGDGWTFRGRGFIQITGRANYTAFAASIGRSLPDAVAYCETVAGALESSLWFWKTRGLDKYDDNFAQLPSLTRLINGGLNGEKEREALYVKATAVIN